MLVLVPCWFTSTLITGLLILQTETPNVSQSLILNLLANILNAKQKFLSSLIPVFCFPPSEVVQYAENILKQIYEGIKITNIDTAIQDSRRVLDQIKSANFSGNAEECTTEEALAKERKS